MIDTNDLPARSRRQGRFDLAIPAAQAFDLFTAEGERQWVAGWDPVILSACGALRPGAVFLTDHGGESTIWTVIAAGRGAGRLHYSRVSPGRRAGTVEVRIAPAKSGASIHVAYDMTALGPDGEAAVTAMDETAITAMLGEWKRMIEAAVIDPSGAATERELAR
jgi:hypothetical protein